MTRAFWGISILLYTTGIMATTADEYCILAEEYSKHGNFEKAAACYQNILNENPHNRKALFLLGNLFAHNGQYQDAIKQYQTLLVDAPRQEGPLYNIAYCLRSLGLFEQAVKTYTELLSINSNNSDARQGRSHALLALGKLTDAWPDFEYRWTKPRPDSHRFATFMHATNNDIKNKIIVIVGEFGQGDTLQFIRYGKMLKDLGATVIAQVQPTLVPLLSKCPYLDQVIPVDTPLPNHHLKTALMSLPWAFQTTIESIPNETPYIEIDAQLQDEWHNYLAKDKNFKVGLCWHGNGYTSGNLKKLVEQKSIPLALLAPLAALETVSFYSLQVSSGLDELNSLPEDFKIHTFKNLDTTHGPFMDTAAIMKELDLVITIDTSTAHLAGGLGVPVWTLLPHVADWRWLTERDDSPWYPTMRLFRQSAPGNWDAVVHTIKKALEQELKKKNLSTKKTIPTTLQVPVLYKEGIAAYQAGNLDAAADSFSKALALQPENANLSYALALTERKRGNISTAIPLYQNVLQHDQNHTDAAFGLAQSYHAIGKVAQCWQLFNRWRKEKLSTYPTKLSEVYEKSVLITAEWGLGDMLNFIRYAKELKKAGVAHLYVESHRPLVTLLSQCPYIDTIIPKGETLPAVDYSMPLLYLPTLFKTGANTIPAEIPYLYPSQDLVQKWHQNIPHDTMLNVGICWDMGHYDTNLPGWTRAIPLEQWLPILSVDDVRFYSLQKENLESISQLPNNVTVHIFEDFDTRHGGFMDSAALMQHLDLVITVDTAVAHLAGGLGVPVWTFLPSHPDYRWMLERTDTPWYPTMKLFRQQKADNWTEVIELVAQKLLTLSTTKKAKLALGSIGTLIDDIPAQH